MLFVIIIIIIFLFVFMIRKNPDTTAALLQRYSDTSFHVGMLNDTHRMNTYKTALEKNPSLIQGAKVLDVGCGTGVLGAFAHRGGASKVVGVDILSLPKVQGTENITFVSGKPIEKARLPEKKFDVIVSEWMGQLMYEENLVDMFLYARDKYLKPGGAMIPDIGNIYVTGFKGKQYGIPGCKSVEYIQPQDMVTNDYKIHNVDFTTVNLSDTFTIASDIELHGHQDIDGLVIWFDVECSPRFCKENPVTMDTKRLTSWFHAIVRFNESCEPSDVKNIRLEHQQNIVYKVFVNDTQFTEMGDTLQMDWREIMKKVNPNHVHRIEDYSPQR